MLLQILRFPLNCSRLCYDASTMKSHPYRMLFKWFLTHVRFLFIAILPDVHVFSLTGLSVFTEPSYLFYDVPTPALNEAVAEFKMRLGFGQEDLALMNNCRKCVINRVRLQEEAIERTVCINSILSNDQRSQS
jgi:hypothetical protein